MNVALFGATGMVGQGVMRACLLDPGVERVIAVGRHATGQVAPKLREIVIPDVADLHRVAAELTDLDACFFCLGVSAAGLSEAAYTRVTYDLSMAVVQTLAKLNGSMTFVYVSGMGTDGSERSAIMWARVKGRTENALLRLPFKVAYMFRPGLIIPLHGARSRTAWYQLLYLLAKPFYPLLKRMFPRAVTTTDQVGRAMLMVARDGYPKAVLESADINAL
ncbi:MAG: epimerase [Gemmatimonadaceae bacterium]